MDELKSTRLYLQRKAAMTSAFHTCGEEPGFGVFEITMMLGMSFLEADLAYMLYEGMTLPEIEISLRGNATLQEIKDIIAGYGGAKKMVDMAENAMVLAIWIVDMGFSRKKTRHPSTADW